jgi:CTP:molybdopterin cytidylyltransferase MocA
MVDTRELRTELAENTAALAGSKDPARIEDLLVVVARTGWRVSQWHQWAEGTRWMCVLAPGYWQGHGATAGEALQEAMTAGTGAVGSAEELGL